MSDPVKTPHPLLTVKSKKALIGIIIFVSGALSGIFGAPYAPFIKVATDVSVQALETAPVKEEKPAVVEAPVAPVVEPVVGPVAPPVSPSGTEVPAPVAQP